MRRTLRVPGWSGTRRTPSGDATKEVAILRDGAGEDLEVDLAVVVDGHHPHDRLSLVVAGTQHRSRTDSIRHHRVGERRPSEAVVVLGVEVSSQIEVVHGITCVE